MLSFRLLSLGSHLFFFYASPSEAHLKNRVIQFLWASSFTLSQLPFQTENQRPAKMLLAPVEFVRSPFFLFFLVSFGFKFVFRLICFFLFVSLLCNLQCSAGKCLENERPAKIQYPGYSTFSPARSSVFFCEPGAGANAKRAGTHRPPQGITTDIKPESALKGTSFHIVHP